MNLLKHIPVLTALALALMSSEQRGLAAGSPDIVISTQPLSQNVSSGATVAFTVVAAAPGSIVYQWTHGGQVIPGASQSVLTITNVQIGDAGDYVVTVRAAGKKLDSAVATLTVNGVSLQDTTGPRLRVSSPTGGNVQTTEPTILFSGSANDDTQVSGVFYQIGGADWVDLGSSTNWSFSPSFAPGTNVVRIWSADIVGNNSATQQVTVFYSVSQALDLTVSGAGTVIGATNGQSLELGRNYTIRAVPSAGAYFSHWTVDGVVTTNSTLSFAMASNLVVTATFVGNPFIALQGIYNALFYDSVLPVHESSGILSLKLTDQGRFTGKAVLAGETLTFNGQFAMDLTASVTANRRAPNPPVTFGFQLQTGTDELSGSVSGDGFDSAVVGYRSVFTVARPATNFVGKYTLAFAGTTDSSVGPEGLGYALATVTAAGAVQLKGMLADGMAATQKGTLAANGQWPVYLPLYRGQGSLLGWIAIADDGENDLSGLMLWTRPAAYSSIFHPLGFANEVAVIGSRYETTASGVPMLNLDAPVVYLEGGNLDDSVISNVTLDTFNKLTVGFGETNKLAVKLTAANGLVSGSFVHPQTAKKSVIRGIVLQRQNVGAGFFLGTNQSGAFFLGNEADYPVFH